MDWQLRWPQLWSLLGIDVSNTNSLVELQAQYAESHRAYHTLQHIAECLQHFDAVQQLIQSPVEVELALWYHDVIYDTHRNDNEEASAQWAERALFDAAVAEAITQRVTNLITLTKHVAEPVDEDGAFLLDIDLAILGASPMRFAEYEMQVRQEYAWVSWPAFCRGRAKILQSFLQRTWIYRTTFFQKCFETQARLNLTASLAKLNAG